MKKIKTIFTALLLATMVFSCESDGGTSVIKLIEGAAPNIKKVSTTDQGLNVVALRNGQNINLGLTVSVGRGDVESMDIVGIYTKGTVVEKAVLKANVTGFPATVNITQTDLYSAFALLNSVNDIALSDKLTISADLKLKDGRVIKMINDKGVANYGADISNSLDFSVLQNYIVSCPLTDASLFTGNYKVTVDQWADYTIGATVPVVINPADGPNTFRILSTTNPSVVNPGVPYMLVTINPATATVTSIRSNTIYDYGTGGTASVTAGTGTLSSCTGDMNLKVTWGPYGTANFNLVKL
jgi:hypothetical protein